MKILAFDTATEACSVALWYDGQIQERFVEQPKGHGALILDMINATLYEAGLRLKDLDALAFGRGPGSFTGVRIATAITQAIGFGADLPLIPISNLAMLAQGYYRETKITHLIPALDARMKEIYISSYQIINELAQATSDEQLVIPEKFILLNLNDSNWHGMGRGWTAYEEVLKARLGQQLIAVIPEFLCHAQDALPLAVEAFSNGNTIISEQVLPVYLRNKVANVPN